MKITVRHRGTEIVVEETHEKERATMRYSDQNKQIQETITVIVDQVKKLQETVKAD